MGNRDAEFRKARERAASEGRIQRAIADGNPQVFPRDRFGVPIQIGTNVLFRPSFDFVYEVKDVRPVLDPNIPPGHVQVVLVSATTLTLPAGQPLMSMVCIGNAAPPPEEKPAEETTSAQGDGDHGPAEPAVPSGLILTDVQ